MANTTEAEVYLVNLETNQKLPIMFIPEDISWEAASKWAVIPTIARNNPFYQYTGGEDTVSFQLDWYAGDIGRISAINAAQLVKSWSRNNGYEERPPRIQLIWGDLFKSHVFIITKASYRMSLFDRTHKMIPVQIYQDLELKKITDDNETHEDISAPFNQQEFDSLFRKWFDPMQGKWFAQAAVNQSVTKQITPTT